MIWAAFRREASCCRGCSAPLGDARVVSRSWRKIRPGEWIGHGGRRMTVVCACGQKAGVLWAVIMGVDSRPAA